MTQNSKEETQPTAPRWAKNEENRRMGGAMGTVEVPSAYRWEVGEASTKWFNQLEDWAVRGLCMAGSVEECVRHSGLPRDIATYECALALRVAKKTPLCYIANVEGLERDKAYFVIRRDAGVGWAVYYNPWNGLIVATRFPADMYGQVAGTVHGNYKLAKQRLVHAEIVLEDWRIVKRDSYPAVGP